MMIKMLIIVLVLMIVAKACVALDEMRLDQEEQSLRAVSSIIRSVDHAPREEVRVMILYAQNLTRTPHRMTREQRRVQQQLTYREWVANCNTYNQVKNKITTA